MSEAAKKRLENWLKARGVEEIPSSDAELLKLTIGFVQDSTNLLAWTEHLDSIIPGGLVTVDAETSEETAEPVVEGATGTPTQSDQPVEGATGNSTQQDPETPAVEGATGTPEEQANSEITITKAEVAEHINETVEQGVNDQYDLNGDGDIDDKDIALAKD